MIKGVFEIFLNVVLFLVSCFCLIPAFSSAESLPYEVFPLTSSWWYTPIENALYFSGQKDDQAGIWKSDATESSTNQISENIFSYQMMHDIHDEKIGTFVFFVADQNSNGTNELYIVNEADGMNYLIEEFKEDLLTRSIWPLKVYKQNFFFYAYTKDEGFEIWLTAGAPDSATLVKDICSGSCDSTIGEMVEFNGYLFFAADDNINGLEFWVSNGTSAGTLLLANIYSEAGGPVAGDDSTSSAPQDFIILGDKLLFTANDGIHGRELWISDGVPDGVPGGVPTSKTTLLKDCTPGDNAGDPYDSFPDDLLLYKGKVYFTLYREELYLAPDWDYHWELWETDGTEEGTVKLGATYVEDIDGGKPLDMIAMNDKLFLTMQHPTYGHEIFYVDLVSDDKSLHLLKDVYPGSDEYGYPQGSWSGPLAVVSGSSIGKEDLFYFVADSPGYGREFWVSDGTAAGTHLLKDLTPGTGSSTIDELTVINSTLFFRFDNWYLWAIDRNYDSVPAHVQSSNFPWTMFLPAITGKGSR